MTTNDSKYKKSQNNLKSKDSLRVKSMKKLQHCVYVLCSLKDNNLYIGYTTNLHERLTSHISGNSQATKFRRPFILLFCEYFLSKHDAVRREKYFKTTVGKRMLKILLKDSLKEIDENYKNKVKKLREIDKIMNLSKKTSKI